MPSKSTELHLSDEAAGVLEEMRVTLPIQEQGLSDKTKERVAKALEEFAVSTALARSDEEMIEQAREIKRVAQRFIDELSDQSVQEDCTHQWEEKSIPVMCLKGESERREHEYKKCRWCGIRKRQVEE